MLIRSTRPEFRCRHGALEAVFDLLHGGALACPAIDYRHGW